MKTYPYTTDDGIIELVRKDEHDAVVAELQRELDASNASSESELIQEVQANAMRLIAQNERLIGERNKLRTDNAELLERLEERTQSHLHASARDVQTIQQQSVLLDRMANALRALDNLRNDDFPSGGDFSDTATAAFVSATDALAAYESAKSGNLPDPLVEAVKPCDWKQDEDGNWYTACYHFLSFEYSPPNEQGYKFCHHCGHHINFINYTESLV